MSRYHTSFGYTMRRFAVGEEYEYEQEHKNQMDKTAKRFMGRTDHVEFNNQDEILIKDDFGIHIMYDCVESDLEMIANEILLTGSYYIKKQEPLFDAEDTEHLNPIIDRISVLEKLMECEAKYQFKKAGLIRLYMEAYEHIVDPLEQQRFIQLIVDIMAERPRLNLDSCSFEDSYQLELEILTKKRELLENVIRFQIASERKENEKICDYLEKSHELINDSIAKKWQNYRPEDINEEYKKRGLHRNDLEETKIPSSSNSKTVTEKTSHLSSKRDSKARVSPIDTTHRENGSQSPSRVKSPTKNEMQELYKQKRRGLIGLEEEPEDRFSDALGLPKISQDDIYQKYRENDQEALDIMNENATFIRNEEGNPKRFNNKEYLLDTFISGEKIGVLDFYESMG